MKNYGPKATISEVIVAHLINTVGLIAVYRAYNETGFGLVDWLSVGVATVLIGMTFLMSLVLMSKTVSISIIKASLEKQKPILALSNKSNFVWDIAYLAMFVAHSAWIIATLYIIHIVVYNNFRKKLPFYVEALIKKKEERLKKENP